LRGVEAVVSVDRFSNSEGAEGSDILAVALRLVGSGADDTPPSGQRNAKLCQLWVTSELPRLVLSSSAVPLKADLSSDGFIVRS
jgi:hypothetical protein